MRPTRSHGHLPAFMGHLMISPSLNFARRDVTPLCYRSLRVENPARQRDIHRKVRERVQAERNSHTRFHQSYQSMSGLLAGWLDDRSEEHTSELQSLRHLVCRLLLEKK